jgi:hypothetical protein
MCVHWLARAHDRVAVEVRGVADELLLARPPAVAAGRLPIGVGASEREHGRVPPAGDRADGGDRLLPTATGAVRAESGGTRRTSVANVHTLAADRAVAALAALPGLHRDQREVVVVFLVFRPGREAPLERGTRGTVGIGTRKTEKALCHDACIEKAVSCHPLCQSSL